jgi:anti-sigma factor RsiW
MICPKEIELALYVDGEAPDRRTERLERHVKTRASCARKVLEFRLIRSAVASSGSHMAPTAREQVRAEILARISREPSDRAGSHPLLLLQGRGFAKGSYTRLDGSRLTAVGVRQSSSAHVGCGVLVHLRDTLRFGGYK